MGIFDTTGAISREIVGHKKKVHSVAWNITGRKLASGSVDQTARVWDVEHGVLSGKEIELKGHSDSVDQLCWDPTSGDRLATASADKSVRVWDIRSGSKCAASVATSGENINVTWSPDGNTIAVGNRDDVVSFIDTRKHKVIKTTKFPFEVNEIKWDKSGKTFYLTTGLGTVEVLSFPKMQTLHTLQAHTAGCYCIEFDPINKHFAVGSADALVSLWDLSESCCVRTLPRLEWPVRTLSFSHDGAYLASASEDLSIDIAKRKARARHYVPEVSTGECAHKVPTRAAMNSVAWSTTEYLLAYAGDDKVEGVIRIWGVPRKEV